MGLVSAYQLDVQQLAHKFLFRYRYVKYLEASSLEPSVRSDAQNGGLVPKQFEFINMGEEQV